MARSPDQEVGVDTIWWWHQETEGLGELVGAVGMEEWGVGVPGCHQTRCDRGTGRYCDRIHLPQLVHGHYIIITSQTMKVTVIAGAALTSRR